MTDTSPSRPARLRLRVLCTTDLHAHVWPFDYQTDRPTPGRGLAALATVIRAARADAQNALLLDCGDILQGSALADWAASPAGAAQPHPVIGAMNHLGYDAACLGNHDFNYGLGVLNRALGAARFPVVCANLVAELGEAATDDTPIVPPHCILEREMTDADGRIHRVRIGVLGTAPPQTAIWDAAVLRGAVSARDAVETARAHLPALRAAGCDLIIALSHAGPGRPDPDEMEEDTSLALARLDGIDAVIAGHSHRRLPGPDFRAAPGVDAEGGRLAGKPAVMPGAFGSDLGVMDLVLERVRRRWILVAGETALHPADGATADPGVLALTRPAHDATRAGLSRVVGAARTRLHSVFAMTGRSPALTLLAEAQAESARALVAGTRLADMPLLSAVAPFKHGGPMGPRGFVDIPAGHLRQRHMVELSPFPNQLCVLALTGADLRAWLERIASAYCTVAPDARDAPLLATQAAAYTFDEIHGLRYTVDLSRPPLFDAQTGRSLDGGDRASGGAGRIVGLTCDGREVSPKDRFAVATSSYRASGGGGFAMIPPDTPRLHSRGTLLDILTAYVAARGAVAPEGPAPWRFAPIGASARVRTAPDVTLAEHGDPDRRLEPLGQDSDGYALFRLAL